MKDTTIYSKIELETGFYQILIEPADAQKTRFIFPFGQFKHSVLPFTMVNAPKSLQKAMTNILEGLDFTRIFVDDILIATNGIDHKILV